MAALPPPASEAESNELRVCTEEELRRTGSCVVPIAGKKGAEAIVFHLGERGVYAVDKHCYHDGAELIGGKLRDIEDMPCIQCPRHNYIISLKTGEGMYMRIDMKNREKPPQWTSKGVKQRTHQVTLRDGWVYLRLSDYGTKIESDHYNPLTFKPFAPS